MLLRRKFKHKGKKSRRSIFLRGWFLAFVVFGMICLTVSYFVFEAFTESYKEKAAGYDLQKIRDIERPNVILDRNNDEVGRTFEENRAEVTIDLVPQKMIDALVAGEDSRFFTHKGVDYVGLLRAVKGFFKDFKIDSGASTVTMQLARNAFPLQADAQKEGGSKYDRKITEIFLAHRIESKFSKDQIMEFYLNRINFGSGFYGIRAAALGYYGKEPRDLEVWECASIVGAVKNPSKFTPLRNPENNKKSRDNVLNRMSVEGFITQEECEAYKKKPVVMNSKPIRRGTSYFYDKVDKFIKAEIPEKLRDGGGLKIFTTLDKSLQDDLQNSIQEQLYLVEKTEGYTHPKFEDFKPGAGKHTDYLQGAGICFNHKTGEVLAYVGGRSFKHSQYDFIESGTRPLGTAFLPFVYAAALEDGLSMSSPVIDEPMDNRMVMISGQEGILAEWGSEVFEPVYEGIIPARQALAFSKISASVRLGKKVGLAKVSRLASRFGLEMPRTRVQKRVLTRGLIGSEGTSLMTVAKAYAAIANGGIRPESLSWVKRIENQYGEVLYTSDKEFEQQQVIEPEHAFLVHSALEDVWKKGNLREAFVKGGEFDFHGGVKTGTTANFADHWSIGYNSDITCAVWSGFFNGNSAVYEGAFAKDIAFPIWQTVMRKVNSSYGDNRLVQPDSVVSTLVCSKSGLKCTTDCHEQHKDAVTGKINFQSTGIMELFKKGDEPTRYCDVHGEYNIDMASREATKDLTTSDLLYVLPIRPQVVALVGEDPYGAKIPEYDPFTHKSTNYVRPTTINVLEIGKLDEVSTIQQPRPGRVFMDQ
ncbi:transglycosylase domain-containing protein [Akkermansiaceae bacterium]|nr:transglycosylase domain-containing protein [Akkermansiaceae bacterium]